MSRVDPLPPSPSHPSLWARIRGNLSWLLPAAVLWGFLGWLTFVELPRVAGLFDQSQTKQPGLVRLLMQTRLWFLAAAALLVGIACWTTDRLASRQFYVLAMPAVLIVVVFNVVHQPITSWLENLKPQETSELDVAPRVVLEKAIAAHGGREKFEQTLMGRYRVVVKSDSNKPAPGGRGITWKQAMANTVIEETFELPRRYRRKVTSTFDKKQEVMEYAITLGNGWIREYSGNVKDYAGRPQSVDQYWQSFLAVLPAMLFDHCKLEPAGTEMIGIKTGVGVRVVNILDNTTAVLHFDRDSGLLLRAKRRMQPPILNEPADMALVYDNYQTVSGVQFPMRISSYIDGEKVFEFNIQEMEFLKNVDDSLFEKPSK